MHACREAKGRAHGEAGDGAGHGGVDDGIIVQRKQVAVLARGAVRRLKH